VGKYKNETSKEVIAEAEKMAKATQRPGQTKEQTKLIAQGIQKGIEQYKKNNKVKTRELDKKLKNIKKVTSDGKTEELIEPPKRFKIMAVLPWSLLVLSWLFFYLN